ncbi:MAG: hypothetical protein Ta2E_11360 [Mycoplasmoidaceae bacterium]|nr:MAG: hypothetical protein Ta2E_11360 [Mycoplasmoidaceae bacterium]
METEIMSSINSVILLIYNFECFEYFEKFTETKLRVFILICIHASKKWFFHAIKSTIRITDIKLEMLMLIKNLGYSTLKSILIDFRVDLLFKYLIQNIAHTGKEKSIKCFVINYSNIGY